MERGGVGPTDAFNLGSNAEAENRQHRLHDYRARLMNLMAQPCPVPSSSLRSPQPQALHPFDVVSCCSGSADRLSYDLDIVAGKQTVEEYP